MTLKTDRIEAAKAGEKHYQGVPCKHGHSGVRYTLTSNCVECTKAASKKSLDRIRKLLNGSDAA